MESDSKHLRFGGRVEGEEGVIGDVRIVSASKGNEPFISKAQGENDDQGDLKLCKQNHSLKQMCTKESY